ncbi:MAG: glucose 1-dehydrogenase [Acidimicrobiales bacterium]|jgi:NAD(P)-dependent dehydrogenase (short-subunit alcohol dehydrogenase family)
MNGRFEGRVALVTGGASGIGRATVEQLAADGARVVVADLDDAGGADVVDAVRAAGGEAVFVRTDVAVPDDVDAMVATAVGRFGRLDVAVNNAARPGTYAPLAEQTIEDWERTIAVNLTATFLCLRAEIPPMLATGGGAIVNVASAAGLMGFAHLPAYVASKHGVIGLTRSVALEFAKQGVRVNAVCPGNVRTQMLEGFAGGDEQTLQGMGRMQPIGRLGTPQEVAEAIVWLCSDAASFVTGHAMAVDGGVLAT